MQPTQPPTRLSTLLSVAALAKMEAGFCEGQNMAEEIEGT